jgi:hypothetical protein
VRVTIASILVVLGSAGCDGEEGVLLVDLRTDMIPGVEYVRARTTLDSGRPAALVVETDAARGDDFIAGRRIAAFDEPPEGVLALRVELLAPDGRVVIARPIRVSYGGGRFGVTVVMTRNCRGIECPGTGDPTSDACLDGQCVPAECTETTPGSCDVSGCAADTECDGTAASCTSGRCAGRTCLVVVDDGACTTGQRCDPEVGCVVAVPPDAGACDCDPDLDGDGTVGIGDFNEFLPCFDETPMCTDAEAADLDCDGDVDGCDFGLFQCAFSAGVEAGCCAVSCGACDGTGDAGMSCSFTTEDTCTSMSGVYRGDGTSCPTP